MRDSTNDAIIAKITASAIGTNRKRATPSSSSIGTNTMQMHSSDTKAGATICDAPSRIALRTSLPCSRCQLTFSIVTVASSTRMPTASARPPSVITLSVSPAAASAAIAASTASGMDAAMISVERQLPRNSRIIADVSAAAISPSRATPLTAPFTNTDWSPITTSRSDGGSVASMRGSCALTPAMMSSVDAEPLFSTLISTARRPSTRTMLPCGGKPSRTCATSRMKITAPFTVRIGSALSWSMVNGLLLRRMLYSKPPIFCVPAGMIWFCCASAVATSCADSPLACSACGSRSICTWRTLPPYGDGIATPATDSNCGRITLVA